ncbi:hypothetical protein AB0G04_25455 [Actinoplanes sp. NPDC023801]|uniref:hypothetical protein n=1 Tax=Actinoplanes sp. NPDC023801 TaxID=3154595 RepID=UPI0033E821E2
MTRRFERILMMTAVASVIFILPIVISVLSRPTAGCACSSSPDLTPAGQTAARFAGLVRAGDSAGAWALLTDDAQKRYGNPARFGPVLERLAAADRQAAGEWHIVSDHYAGGVPRDVVLARYTGPQHLFAVVVVRFSWNRPDANRVDPEPPGPTVRVTGNGTAGLQVTGVDPHELPRFLLVNPAGEARKLVSSQAPEGGHRLTVPDGARSGHALLAVAMPSVSGWSVAAVPIMPGTGGRDADGRHRAALPTGAAEPGRTPDATPGTAGTERGR